MMAADGELAQVYVQPGESHLTTQPAILRTLLGSCVAIALLEKPGGIGALCHPMLPRCPDKVARSSNVKNSRRYVDFAIRELALRFDAYGIRRESVKVKLFGGADVLQVPVRGARPTVGRLNCESALRVLREEGFDVAASSLGGTKGLTLEFNTGTGEVLVRRLS
jgi:chemotaxis protein CheD